MGSISSVFQVLQAMQLLSLVPLYEVNMPANVQIFFKFIMQVAAFDFIPIEPVYDSLFDNLEYKPTSDKF